MTALAGWENFYVMVGSSAGALIGLLTCKLQRAKSRPARLLLRRRSFISEPRCCFQQF